MNSLIDIENASAEALKASRPEAIKIAKASDHEALAERYVQARLDATTRDELLSDQGETIGTLTKAFADKEELAKSESDRADNAERILSESRAATNKSIGELEHNAIKIAKDADSRVSALTAKLTDATKALNEKTQLAKSRRAALADVVDTATQAVADISAVANRLLAEE